MQLEHIKISSISRKQEIEVDSTNMIGVQMDSSIIKLLVVHKQTNDIGKTYVKVLAKKIQIKCIYQISTIKCILQHLVVEVVVEHPPQKSLFSIYNGGR